MRRFTGNPVCGTRSHLGPILSTNRVSSKPRRGGLVPYLVPYPARTRQPAPRGRCAMTGGAAPGPGCCRGGLWPRPAGRSEPLLGRDPRACRGRFLVLLRWRAPEEHEADEHDQSKGHYGSRCRSRPWVLRGPLLMRRDVHLAAIPCAGANGRPVTTLGVGKGCWLANANHGCDRDGDEALTQLERCANEGSMQNWIIAPEPLFDPLRAEPRFRDVLGRLDLPAWAPPGREPARI